MNKKLLSRFERDMQLRGLSSLTQEAYIRSAGRFAEFLGKNPRGASAQDVKRYLHDLMGHASIQSTARYVHLTTARMINISSPLELLGKSDGKFLG